MLDDAITRQVTRRTLLRAGAGGTALLAVGRLPAWAKPIAAAAGHRRSPDSLPFPHLPAGHPSMPQIEHIVVLMMENHSFDNLLGMVPYQVPGRTRVDGLKRKHGRVQNSNPNPATGRKLYASHRTDPCQLSGSPSQSWDASHTAWDNGRMDGFVRASGPVAMQYWDRTDIPFTYSLAKHFPLGQRYFCSVLAQTYPNRRFFFCATASGLTATDNLTFSTPAANGTIFDRLDAHNINWQIYWEGGAGGAPSVLIVPGFTTPPGRGARFHDFSQFITDCAAGRLPQFSFIDPNYTTTSEENPQDIQVGEEFVAQVVHAVLKAPTWHKTALFITYDEHGGYYDHVPPPPAIEPDSIQPILTPYETPGAYNRYGFRVPQIVVSPWAKPGYASSVVQDHTSMTAFIEHKWNLPAMTYRDANAHPMTDYFDFKHAAFKKPPRLAAAPGLKKGLAECTAAGLTPPLPTS
jgi:phospholipase C